MGIRYFEPSEPVADMVGALEADGAIIVRNHIPTARMQEFRSEVDAMLDGEPFADEHFFGGAHRVKFGLFREGNFVDLLVDDLVGQLRRGPVGHRSAAFLGQLTRDRDDCGSLLGPDPTRATRPVVVAENARYKVPEVLVGRSLELRGSELLLSCQPP